MLMGAFSFTEECCPVLVETFSGFLSHLLRYFLVVFTQVDEFQVNPMVWLSLSIL